MIRGGDYMQEFENPDRWDRTARHYQQTAHPFTARFAEAALARVALTPESYVLDVAAGTGALALAAARTGAKVMATDFSPGMVACVAAAGLRNVEARVMNGQALDLPDATCDAAWRSWRRCDLAGAGRGDFSVARPNTAETVPRARGNGNA
jgi:predicted RNA methylase